MPKLTHLAIIDMGKFSLKVYVLDLLKRQTHCIQIFQQTKIDLMVMRLNQSNQLIVNADHQYAAQQKVIEIFLKHASQDYFDCYQSLLTLCVSELLRLMLHLKLSTKNVQLINVLDRDIMEVEIQIIFDTILKRYKLQGSILPSDQFSSNYIVEKISQPRNSAAIHQILFDLGTKLRIINVPPAEVFFERYQQADIDFFKLIILELQILGVEDTLRFKIIYEIANQLNSETIRISCPQLSNIMQKSKFFRVEDNQIFLNTQFIQERFFNYLLQLLTEVINYLKRKQTKLGIIFDLVATGGYTKNSRISQFLIYNGFKIIGLNHFVQLPLKVLAGFESEQSINTEKEQWLSGPPAKSTPDQNATYQLNQSIKIMQQQKQLQNLEKQQLQVLEKQPSKQIPKASDLRDQLKEIQESNQLISKETCEFSVSSFIEIIDNDNKVPTLTQSEELQTIKDSQQRTPQRRSSDIAEKDDFSTQASSKATNFQLSKLLKSSEMEQPPNLQKPQYKQALSLEISSQPLDLSNFMTPKEFQNSQIQKNERVQLYQQGNNMNNNTIQKVVQVSKMNQPLNHSQEKEQQIETWNDKQTKATIDFRQYQPQQLTNVRQHFFQSCQVQSDSSAQILYSTHNLMEQRQSKPAGNFKLQRRRQTVEDVDQLVIDSRMVHVNHIEKKQTILQSAQKVFAVMISGTHRFAVIDKLMQINKLRLQIDRYFKIYRFDNKSHINTAQPAYIYSYIPLPEATDFEFQVINNYPIVKAIIRDKKFELKPIKQ